jgi:hypothetical protein
MSLRNQFVDVGEPAAKPIIRRPVTESLRAQIDRVEPDETNAPVATYKPATYTKPVATNEVATNAKPVRTANRRTPEAYREYQRSYMAKRRAAVKVTGPEDRASLAKVDP